MKGKRFSELQIVSILKEGEAGIPVVDLCRKHGIGQSTCLIPINCNHSQREFSKLI